MQAFNIQGICHTTYLKHQRTLLLPTINWQWKQHQNSVIAEALKGRNLVLGGDMRADSPGMCSYVDNITFPMSTVYKCAVLNDYRQTQITETSSKNIHANMPFFRTQCKVWNILDDGPQSKQDYGHSAHSGMVALHLFYYYG